VPSDVTINSDTVPVVAGLRILLVEDEPALRRLLARLLNMNGFAVTEAADGIEALQLVSGQDGAPDLLVSDVVMPRMGGLELAVELRLLHPQLPVLFISGYTDNLFLESEELRHGTSFLAKPFPPQALIGKVKEILAAGGNAAPAAG